MDSVGRVAADAPDPLYAQELTLTVYSQTPLAAEQDLNEVARALAAGESVATVSLGEAKPVDGLALAELLSAAVGRREDTGHHDHGEHFHVHTDERGFVHRCYHRCRHWLSPGFLAGWLVANTITFPVEHIMWDHIWPYDYVGAWLDHTGHLSNALSAVWLISFVLMIFAGIRYTVTRRASY